MNYLQTTKSETVVKLLMLIIGAFVLITFLLWIKTCEKPPPKQTEKVIIDTVLVHSVQTKTVYRDRIKARIDTVYIHDSEAIGYEASIDTTVIFPKARIKTQIQFRHPEQTFTFRQTASVDVDTVYINKERIVTKTKIKTSWTNTAIGTAIGFIGGLVTAIELSK